MFDGSYKNGNFVNLLYEVLQLNILVWLNFGKIFTSYKYNLTYLSDMVT